MGNILSSLLGYLLVYKYLAIFVITFFGAFALPVPSGTIVMAAAAFSVQGYMNLYLVWAVAVAGNMAGDSSGYWLVRLYGLRMLNRLGLGRFFKHETLHSIRKQIEKHRILTIYFSRFLTAVAPAVNVICGFTELPYKEFLLFEALGELTEVSCFTALGYIFGANWQYISQLSGSFWVVILVGMLVSYMIWKVILKRNK